LIWVLFQRFQQDHNYLGQNRISFKRGKTLEYPHALLKRSAGALFAGTPVIAYGPPIGHMSYLKLSKQLFWHQPSVFSRKTLLKHIKAERLVTRQSTGTNDLTMTSFSLR